jgi:hypothetical protein
MSTWCALERLGLKPRAIGCRGFAHVFDDFAFVISRAKVWARTLQQVLAETVEPHNGTLGLARDAGKRTRGTGTRNTELSSGQIGYRAKLLTKDPVRASSELPLAILWREGQPVFLTVEGIVSISA